MSRRSESGRARVHSAARKPSIQVISLGAEDKQTEMPSKGTHRNQFPKVSENPFEKRPESCQHVSPKSSNTPSSCIRHTFYDVSKTTARGSTAVKSDVIVIGKPKDAYTIISEEGKVNTRNCDKRQYTANEIFELEQKIKNIWGTCTSEAYKGQMVELERDLTAAEMLDFIELSMKNSKEKLKRQLKLEEHLRFHRAVLTHLCNVINEASAQRKTTEESGGDDFDIQRIGKALVETLKRWKTDRHIFKHIAEPLLEDIFALLTTGPLHCVQPKQIDTEESIKHVSPLFKNILSGMCYIKQCLDDVCQSFQKRFVCAEKFVDLQENNRKQNSDIAILQKEKDELMNRLSKLAGANLTDNNPGIADLSDPNRATKLAEQYSELYDNQWTDAFEDLETTEERECIAYLLNILVETYETCGIISRSQEKILVATLLSPTGCFSLKTEEKTATDVDAHSLSKVQSRSLAELRKQCAVNSVTDVKKFIARKYETWMEKESLKNYTFKCIELCWLMNLQTPPVYLNVDMKIDSTFDTNKYKQYTKSGPIVDYLVWPVLFLHKGGPLLCKGVAQGK